MSTSPLALLAAAVRRLEAQRQAVPPQHRPDAETLFRDLEAARAEVTRLMRQGANLEAASVAEDWARATGRRIASRLLGAPLEVS